MPPVNSGHLIQALRDALQHGATQRPDRDRRERLDHAAKQQTVELVERILDGRADEPTTRTLAVAVLVNLAESYGIEV